MSTHTCTLNPLQICRGTLGIVVNVSHTEEWAQRGYSVHCSMQTTLPGHWQLRWGDHRVECSVWTHTVSLPDPSTEQQSSWYANLPMNFQWIMISDLLVLNHICYMKTWCIMHNSYGLLFIFLLIVECTPVLSLIFLKTRAFVPDLRCSACLVSSDTEGKLVLATNKMIEISSYTICWTYFIFQRLCSFLECSGWREVHHFFSGCK